MRIAIGLAVLAAPSLAAARPFTAGVTLGETQSQVEANADPNHTLGLFGRLGISPRVAGQLEIQRTDTTSSSTDIRGGTLGISIDLGSSPHLVPLVFAGAGLDRASTGFGGEIDAHHFEAGLGLEYRTDGGFVIGADARIGDRTIDSDTTLVPLAGGTIALYEPSTLRDGEYRSLRLTMGIRF